MTSFGVRECSGSETLAFSENDENYEKCVLPPKELEQLDCGWNSRKRKKAHPVSWHLVFVQVNPFTDLTDKTDFHRLLN